MSGVVSRRFLYAALLAAALFGQMMSDNYWTHFALAVLLALPLVSVALSLPGLCTCRISLVPSEPAPGRGTAAVWRVTCRTGFFPVARLSMRCVETNRFTGQRRRMTVKLNGFTGESGAALDAQTAHCGVLELRVYRLRAADALGLFPLSLPAPAPAQMLCRPVPVPVPVPAPARDAGPLSGAQARGGAEDFDLRPFRPGDPLRAVHWKLSAKWDDLIVREPLGDRTRPLLLTLDRFGTPETLDEALDRLFFASRALLKAQRPHAVLWLDAAGAPVLRTVEDEDGLGACLRVLLGSAAPARGRALTERDLPAGYVRLHVTGEGGGGDA